MSGLKVGDIRAMIDNGLQNIDVSIPCVVTSFNENGGDEPFVNVIPSIRRKSFDDERNAVYEDREEIQEIPIGYMSNQGFAITIPIQAGDRGYLIASNLNLDNWDIDGDEQADPYDASFKSFGDSCYFIPGVWAKPKGLVLYNPEALVMRTMDNRTNITLSNGMIQINADQILMNGIAITTVNPATPATFVPLPPVSPTPPVPVNRP